MRYRVMELEHKKKPGSVVRQNTQGIVPVGQTATAPLRAHLMATQAGLGNRYVQRMVTRIREGQDSQENQSVQTNLEYMRAGRRENRTGLPDALKLGVEQLSGYSLDDVRVYYNSAKPAELQALAYTQGTQIYIASGQERHLPHEAWHVVQQAQGRVKPTAQMKDGIRVNDDACLEHDADVMGKDVLRSSVQLKFSTVHQKSPGVPLQKRTIDSVRSQSVRFSRVSPVSNSYVIQKVPDPEVMPSTGISLKWVHDNMENFRTGKNFSLPPFEFYSAKVENFYIRNNIIQYSVDFCRNTDAAGLLFVLHHELAHVHHRHADPSGLHSVENEMQADFTALITSVTHTIGSGEGITAGNAALGIFDQWLAAGKRGGGTHPLNEDRRNRLAKLIDAIKRFARVRIFKEVEKPRGEVEPYWRVLTDLGLESKDYKIVTRHLEGMDTSQGRIPDTSDQWVQMNVDENWTYDFYLRWLTQSYYPNEAKAPDWFVPLKVSWIVTPLQAYYQIRDVLQAEDDLNVTTQGIAELKI